MSVVFADTGFWIALLNPRDSLHHVARQVEASRQFDRIVTSEMVLAEFLNDLGARGPALRTAASRFVAELQANSGVTVFQQTSSLFWQAANLYAERADKAWSLTDCASFLIMQEHEITDSLTHDRHFEQMGFRVLLRI